MNIVEVHKLPTHVVAIIKPSPTGRLTNSVKIYADDTVQLKLHTLKPIDETKLGAILTKAKELLASEIEPKKQLILDREKKKKAKRDVPQGFIAVLQERYNKLNADIARHVAAKESSTKHFYVEKCTERDALKYVLRGWGVEV